MTKKILHDFVNQHQFVNVLKQEMQRIDPNQKSILFIEPYGATLSLLKRGLAKGWNIMIVTANTDMRIVPRSILDAVHLVIKSDTANESVMLELTSCMHEVIRLHAVIPGFEYFVPIAAKVSQLLNLPGIHPHHVMQLRRKDLMRIQLQRAHIKVPRFRLIRAVDDIEEAAHAIGFPLICKPIDAAGSVHVHKANDIAEAHAHALSILHGHDVLWGYPLSNHLLFEEYISGDEYSVEGVVMNGVIRHFSITEKIVFDQSEFIEIGHIVNPPLSAGIKQSLENYVDKVISALDANHCPFHAEIRIDADGSPVLMEMAARLPGDKIGDLITLSRNLNYFDYVYAAYMGDILFVPHTPTHAVGIRFFYRPDVECYSMVHGLESVKQHQIEEVSLYYQTNENIPSFPKPLRRLGHVIIKQDDYPQLCDQLKKMDECVIFC